MEQIDDPLEGLVPAQASDLVARARLEGGEDGEGVFEGFGGVAEVADDVHLEFGVGGFFLEDVCVCGFWLEKERGREKGEKKGKRELKLIMVL